MEKTAKSFSEFVLRVWAAVMRTFMARYCVKSLTLKSRSNAWRYLLGSKKELALIDKLGLADEELQERLWSYETKLELLRRGRSALLSEVKTEEELDIILKRRDERSLIKALRVYTPSYEKMKELCSSLDPITLMAMAKNTPWVFDSLKPLEVLGAKDGEKIPATYERWQVAVALARVRPAWAPAFLKQLREIVPSKLGEDGCSLMTMFFNIAFEAKVDISEMLPYLYVFRSDLYAEVRENWFEYESIAPYFKVMFPQLLKYLRKNVISSSDDIETKGEKRTDGEEAYAWLKIGGCRLYEPAIYRLLLEKMPYIKRHVLPQLFERLFNSMAVNASSAVELLTLYKLADAPEETAIPAILLSRIEEQKENAVELRTVFPFNGWRELLVKRAIKIMVAKRQFPVERIAELPEEMQKLAVEEMETKSQIEAIDKGDVEKLIETTRLYPVAERYLLSRAYMDKYQHAYIEKWQVDESTFSWMVKALELSIANKEKYIFLYAEKWGLTEEQYLQVMQSWLNDKAPFLKKFLKN